MCAIFLPLIGLSMLAALTTKKVLAGAKSLALTAGFVRVAPCGYTEGSLVCWGGLGVNPIGQVRSSKNLDAIREAPRSPSQQSLPLGPLASRRVTLLFNLLKKGVDTNHLDLSYLAYSPTGAPDRAIFLTTLDTR